jgi:hypothetical protein
MYNKFTLAEKSKLWQLKNPETTRISTRWQEDQQELSHYG